MTKEEPTLTTLKIGKTDVFLSDYESGHGKITISNTDYGSYTYYWGAMGDDLASFLLRINESYFSMKLNPHDSGDFSGKLSVRNIRKRLREDFSYELPWYKHLEAQKELREALKSLETAYSGEDFVNRAYALPKTLYCHELDRSDREEFISDVTALMEEPWHYITSSTSNSTLFLQNLLPKIQKEIKKRRKNLVNT